MDSEDKFFYNNGICSLDDSSSDDEDFMVATMVVNEHISRTRPMFMGSIPSHAPTLNRNR